MAIKVVYNAKYGGFSISQECAQFMADNGSKEAQRMLKEYKDDGICQWWYGNWEGDRHDPLLVQAIETLGRRIEHVYIDAEGEQHGIRALRGTKYIVREYDGLESVIEPDDITWIEVKQ